MTMLGSQWLASPAAAAFNTSLIGNSVWLDGSADYLSKTPGSTGNQKRFLFAFWVQRNAIAEAAPGLYSAGTGDQNDDFNIYWNNSGGGSTVADSLKVNFVSGGSQEWVITTTQLFRDIAWYHIIISVDTAESTAADRVKIYVNGDQVTSFVSPSYPSEDADIDYVNDSANEQRIGRNQGANYLDAYMAQYTFLDGQSIQNSDVTVASFLGTQTFGDNGSQKIPVQDSSVAALATAAEGNSYCLDFGDSSALGNDISGEENDWTANSMAAANQSGSTPSKQYATWNPLDQWIGNYKWEALILGDGALKCTSGNGSGVKSTFNIPDGDWYSEHTCTTVLTNQCIGIATSAALLGAGASTNIANTWAYNVGSGDKNEGTSETAEGDTFSNGDILGLAVKKSGSTINIWYARNNTWQSGDPSTGATPTTTATITEDIFFLIRLTNGGTRETNSNFGQQTFSYTPPTDFLSLGSNNLTAPAYQGIDYFNPVLYAGNGTAIGSGGKAVTGTGFQPDFVWMKNRDQADSHGLYDAVRGTTKQIESDTTTAETTESEGLTAFGSDGFTVGSLAQLNTSSENYVAWQWLGANGTSTNEVGTLTSTVSVAEADHFSIVSYTGSGSNTTVGHGLGAAPEMVIVRELPGGDDWNVYHTDADSSPGGGSLRLDSTAAFLADAALWNSTVPSSTVVSLGTSAETNQSSTAMIAYCFRSVAGVCEVGAYIGNGNADGPFIYTGFKPRYIIWKNADVARDWGIIDTATQTYNPGTLSTVLFANLDNADGDGTQGASGTAYDIDILAGGFKIRVGDSGPNGDGNDFIYMAMADIGGGGTLPPIYGR